MSTAVYRIQRVLVAASSPVARIEAVDSEGHEVRLEVPTLAVHSAAPGRLLVLQWSAHEAPSFAQQTPAQPSETPNTSTSSARPDPVSVDQEFMTLMARGRSTASPTPAAQDRGIDKELNNLLGAAEAKGQK